MDEVVLAIHGGAGVIDRKALGADREQDYRQALHRVVMEAYGHLKSSGSAVDAVEVAVRMLEDCELFNAGRGSVLSASWTVEMDAAIMDGRNRMAGAVAGVCHIKNPVSCARAVMESSSHVLLVGTGAEGFARSHQVEMAEPGYFITPHRLEELLKAQSMVTPALRHIFGTDTVGAVARDAHGHLAAATSTGGITNKLSGRVGDSPIIGAGIWADDTTCAVACTGWGEYFIRSAFAHEVDALIRLSHLDLRTSCQNALSRLQALGGSGGCVAVDRNGNIELPFTTRGMFRGWIRDEGKPHVAIFADEEST